MPAMTDVSTGAASTPAIAGILQRLRDTGQFARVGHEPPGGPAAWPAAFVAPVAWVEPEVGPGATTRVRHVSFTLILSVREVDDQQRLAELDRLAAAARAAIDGQSLTAGCIAGLTRLDHARYDAQARAPEGRLLLAGSLAVLVGA